MDKTRAIMPPSRLADTKALLSQVSGVSVDLVLANLEAADLDLPKLLRLASEGGDDLRPKLKAAGVKKIGQREQLIADLQEEAKKQDLQTRGGRT